MRQARYVLIDDIDGSPAKETVAFSVGKTHYEIDLNEKHLAEFNKSLAKWTQNARKASGRKAKNASAPGAADAPLIRAWANENGIPVSARGRISAEIRERYYRESAQAN